MLGGWRKEKSTRLTKKRVSIWVAFAEDIFLLLCCCCRCCCYCCCCFEGRKERSIKCQFAGRNKKHSINKMIANWCVQNKLSCNGRCQATLTDIFSWLVSWCFEPSQPQRITSGPDIRGQSRMRLSFYVKPLISKHPARWLGLVQCTFNSLSCTVFWRKQFWLFVKFLLVQTNKQTHLHM